MTDTTTRQLPTDHGQLKSYLPAEPADSAVAQARAGRRRLDELIAAASAALDDHDRRARAAVVGLADAAIGGDDLEAANLALVIGQRHVLADALEQLHGARTIIAQREVAAKTNDPTYAAWSATCKKVTREWEQAIATETEEQRFANLVAFAERHRS